VRKTVFSPHCNVLPRVRPEPVLANHRFPQLPVQDLVGECFWLSWRIKNAVVFVQAPTPGRQRRRGTPLTTPRPSRHQRRKKRARAPPAPAWHDRVSFRSGVGLTRRRGTISQCDDVKHASRFWRRFLSHYERIICQDRLGTSNREGDCDQKRRCFSAGNTAGEAQ